MPKVVDIAERRSELAAAAAQLIARSGVGAATIREVAAEAGWTTGALTHYFADKRELLLFTFASSLAERHAAHAASGDRTPHQQLMRLARGRPAAGRGPAPPLDGHHRVLRPGRRRRRALRGAARRLPRLPRPVAQLGRQCGVASADEARRWPSGSSPSPTASPSRPCSTRTAGRPTASWPDCTSWSIRCSRAEVPITAGRPNPPPRERSSPG